MNNIRIFPNLSPSLSKFKTFMQDIRRTIIVQTHWFKFTLRQWKYSAICLTNTKLHFNVRTWLLKKLSNLVLLGIFRESAFQSIIFSTSVDLTPELSNMFQILKKYSYNFCRKYSYLKDTLTSRGWKFTWSSQLIN